MESKKVLVPESEHELENESRKIDVYGIKSEDLFVKEEIFNYLCSKYD